MSGFPILLLLCVTLSVGGKSACSEENDEWPCTSGQCIAKENLCDGTPHCVDGSDEKSCNDMQCSFASFRCRYGACISLGLICDGVVDCVDSSDEDSAMCRKQRDNLPDDGIDDETRRRNCADWGQMKCWSGQCVSINDKCNGRMDCADGSDEQYSLCQAMLCGKQQFQCGYGACIPKEAKCNGSQECWDGTDENEKLCKKEIDISSATTTRINLTMVTKNIINPSIDVTNTNNSIEPRKTHPKTNQPHDIVTIDLKDTRQFEERFNSAPTRKTETISTQKTTVSPIATTSAENQHIDFNRIASKDRTASTIKATIIKKYAGDDLQNTTPNIKETRNFSPKIINGTIDIDLRSHPVLKQHNSIEANGQEVDQNTLPTLSIGTFTLEATILPPPKTATKQTTTTSNRYNITKTTTMIPPTQATTKRQQITSNRFNITNLTTKLPPIKTTIKQPTTASNRFNTTKTSTMLSQTKTTTKLVILVTNRYNLTQLTTILPTIKTKTKYPQTASNWYNILKTTQSTATTKARKECVLRSCGHPLFCNTSVAGSYDSEISYDTQGRLYFLEGSQVSFNCAAGYNLEGERRLTCTPSGWNHNSPSCIPYCNSDFIHNCKSPLRCFFEQPNTRPKVPIPKRFAESRVREHTQISFACDEGYQLEGPEIRKCTVKGWSDEMPRCVNYCNISDLGTCKSPLKCKVFDSSVQKLVDYRPSPWVSKIKENSYFEYSCEEGYKMIGDSRSTCMNNGWSSNSPTCIPLCDINFITSCKAPLSCNFKKTRSSFSFGNRRSNVVKPYPSVYVEFACKSGFELDGAKVITCTDDGWSDRVPTCNETTCDASLLDECNYPLNCEIYDRAIKDYKGLKKGDIQQMSNTEILYMSCENDFILDGSSYVECSGGKWVQNMPKCVEKISETCAQNILDNCTYPMICERFVTEFNGYGKINGAADQKKFSEAEHIKFSCENGYILDGTNLLSCTGGKWDNSMPRCIAGGSCQGDLIPTCRYPLSCTLYDSESKSEQIITDNSKYKSTHLALNSQIIFECANGYKLGGENKTICGENGWSHEQSLKLPHCTPLCDPGIFKSCKEPLSCYYYNREYKKWVTVRSDYLITEIHENFHVYFNCNSGLRLDGPERIECQSKGWDKPLPKCVL